MLGLQIVVLFSYIYSVFSTFSAINPPGRLSLRELMLLRKGDNSLLLVTFMCSTMLLFSFCIWRNLRITLCMRVCQRQKVESFSEIHGECNHSSQSVCSKFLTVEVGHKEREISEPGMMADLKLLFPLFFSIFLPSLADKIYMPGSISIYMLKTTMPTFTEHSPVFPMHIHRHLYK